MESKGPSTVETGATVKHSFILDNTHNAFSKAGKESRLKQTLATCIVCLGCVVGGLAIGLTGAAGNAINLTNASSRPVFNEDIDSIHNNKNNMSVYSNMSDTMSNTSMAESTMSNNETIVPAALPLLEEIDEHYEEARSISWLATSLLLGSSLGVLLYHNVIDVMGHRRVFLLCVTPLFTTGNLLLVMSGHVGVMIFGRVLLGMAISLHSLTSSSYVREIGTEDTVGLLGWSLQWSTSLGIFLAFSMARIGSWSSLLYLSLFLVLFFTLFVWWVVPESPYWLISKGKEYTATKSLRWLHFSKESMEPKIEWIRRQLALEKRQKHSITNAKTHWPQLLTAILLITAVQFSGFPVLLFFGHQMITLAALPSFSLLFMALVLLLSSIAAPFLVQKFNMKMAMVASLMLMGLSQVAIGVCLADLDSSWLTLLFMVVSVMSFNLGFGTLVWLVISQCFPMPTFKHISMLLTFFFYLTGLVVLATHNELMNHSGSIVAFGCYGLVCFMAAIGVGVVNFDRLGNNNNNNETSIKQVVGDARLGDHL